MFGPFYGGAFYMVLRLYGPGEAALDGEWTPPPAEEDPCQTDLSNIPRGSIAAINAPKYVSAEQAKIEDDTFVLDSSSSGTAFYRSG